MEILDKIFRKKAKLKSGEIFQPVIGKLETPEGVITQHLDPDTGRVYHTEYSSDKVQSEAITRGVGSDFTMGPDGKIAEVHPRFQRTKDNPLNPNKRPTPPKEQLP
jgi:hypothetical protein